MQCLRVSGANTRGLGSKLAAFEVIIYLCKFSTLFADFYFSVSSKGGHEELCEYRRTFLMEVRRTFMSYVYKEIIMVQEASSPWKRILKSRS